MRIWANVLGNLINRLSWLVIVAALSLVSLVALSLEGLTTYLTAYVSPELYRSARTQLYPNYSVRVQGQGGRTLGVYGMDESRREPIPEVPDTFKDLLMAFEDARFLQHGGVDRVRLLGALSRTLQGQLEGGSTLTMQLAKMMKGDSARTMRRKLDDMALALALEQHHTKDEILRLYADHAYFGHNMYGVANACRYYFGKKDCVGLALEEAAYLVGLVKAPSKYAGNPKLGKARRDLVLLVAMGPAMPPQDPTFEEFLTWFFIDKGYEEVWEREFQQRDALARKYGRGAIIEARNKPLALLAVQEHDETPYVRDAAVQIVADKIGEEQMKRGADVQLTIDPATQKSAEEALAYALQEAERAGLSSDLDGGVVVLNARTGDVLSLVGGRDYGMSQVPFALRPIQVGSALKPFVYAEAFERRVVKPNEKVLDSRICIGGWCPKNYGGKYSGPLPVEDALARSLNSVAVRLANSVGVDALIRRFRELGIQSPLNANLTLALGASEVTMLELATAYTALLDGAQKNARLIVAASDRQGELLYREPRSEPIRVFTPDTATNIRNAMQRALRPNGTAIRLGMGLQEAWSKNGTIKVPEVSCKTGTTNDSLRVGIMCMMSDSDLGEPIVVGVYLGHHIPKPLGDAATGGRLAGPAMQRILLALSRNQQEYHSFLKYTEHGVQSQERAEPVVAAATASLPPLEVIEVAGDGWLATLYERELPRPVWNDLSALLQITSKRAERFTEKLRSTDETSFERGLRLASKIVRFVALRGFSDRAVGHRTLVRDERGFTEFDEQADRVVATQYRVGKDVVRLRMFVSGNTLEGVDLISSTVQGESYARVGNTLRKVVATKVVVDRGAFATAWSKAGLDEQSLNELRTMLSGTSVNLENIQRGFETTMLMAGRKILAASVKPTSDATPVVVAKVSGGVFDQHGVSAVSRLWPIAALDTELLAGRYQGKRTTTDMVLRVRPKAAVISPTRAYVRGVDYDAHRVFLESASGKRFDLSGIRANVAVGDVVSGGDLLGVVDGRNLLIVHADDGVQGLVTFDALAKDPGLSDRVSALSKQLDFAVSGPTKKASAPSWASLFLAP